MKQLLLFISFLLLTFSSIGQYESQITEEGSNFPDYVDHVFEHLDLSQVPSGLLPARSTPVPYPHRR
jgi:hypothetical protein